LLLGQQLPSIIGHARIDLQQAGGGALWHLPAYVLAITVGLMLLRLLWIWLSLALMTVVAQLSGRTRPRVNARLIGVTVLSGVRGAITLAGVLSLPLTLSDGAAFPARDLLIFLSAGVILCTLLIGSIGLPLTLRHLKLPAEDSQVTEQRDARQQICEGAMQAIQQQLHELEGSDAQRSKAAMAIGSRLLSEYQQRLAVAAEGDDDDRQQARQNSRLERELRSLAIHAGRDRLQQLRRSYRINDQTLRLLQRELDLEETALGAATGA
jgi:CPA1 family monovalent cation:H+ antiporter